MATFHILLIALRISINKCICQVASCVKQPRSEVTEPKMSSSNMDSICRTCYMHFSAIENHICNL